VLWIGGEKMLALPVDTDDHDIVGDGFPAGASYQTDDHRTASLHLVGQIVERAFDQEGGESTGAGNAAKATGLDARFVGAEGERGADLLGRGGWLPVPDHHRQRRHAAVGLAVLANHRDARNQRPARVGAHGRGDCPRQRSRMTARPRGDHHQGGGGAQPAPPVGYRWNASGSIEVCIVTLAAPPVHRRK
jgi:hypothetical protein